MNENCRKLHELTNSMKRFRFTFENEIEKIPKNGVYIVFEEGEKGHSGDRIVRVGTHTGNDQLRSRLKQHFLGKNKNRSIFRQNIGRVFLHKENDPYLEVWSKNMTSKKARENYKGRINESKEEEIERKVTDYMQKNFSFVVIEINDKQKRLEFESKIISTISCCEDCKPSNSWFGLSSPKEKICESGLWQVNELYKTELTEEEMEELSNFIKSK